MSDGLAVPKHKPSSQKSHSQRGSARDAVNNTNLASDLYAISHFNSYQTDATPYGPLQSNGGQDIGPVVGNEHGDICFAGPINIMTFATSNSNRMWQVGTDKVSMLEIGQDANGRTIWTVLAQENALSLADDEFGLIPDEDFAAFANINAEALGSVGAMDEALQTLCQNESNYSSRMGNGLYAVVDKNDILYVQYGRDLFAFHFDESQQQVSSRYRLHEAAYLITHGRSDLPDDITEEELEQQSPPMIGLAMTYDANNGQLVVTFSNGIAVISPELSADSAHFIDFNEGLNSAPGNTLVLDQVSNSIAVDEEGGIYVASCLVTYDIAGLRQHGRAETLSAVGKMRKLVWHNNRLCGPGENGAWIWDYPAYSTAPPTTKKGYGTGSTPSLMNVDGHKFVVITSGEQKMQLLAFWRDIEDADDTNMLFAATEVDCGLQYLEDKGEVFDWVQSEQSVVVNDRYAFVVNNMPNRDDQGSYPKDDSFTTNSILQVASVGPILPGSKGAQKFELSVTTGANGLAGSWQSRWYNNSVSALSMVPVLTHCQDATRSMIFVSGYSAQDDALGTKGWRLSGLNWETGIEEITINLGMTNAGNGAYSIPQLLEGGQLVFNSIVGPRMIDLSLS